MIPAEDTSSSKTCTECGRVFTKAAHLLRHVRSHAREKPFSCSVCRKAFARTDALQRHERTVHCPKRRKTGQGSGSSDGDVDMVTEQPAEMLYQPVEGAETLVQPSMFDMPLASSSSEAISFDGMQSLFSTPSFLAAFPSSAIPSSEAQVDEMILEWLGQGGGAFTTQQALANAVGLQDQDFGFDLLHPAEGQILQPRVQPAVNPIPDAESLFRDSATGCGLVRPIESPTVTRPAEPAPVMCASVARLPERPRFLRASRSVVVEDTWESGLSGRKSNPVSRPDSPQPSKITSPEQFVNELHVEGPDVCVLSETADIGVDNTRSQRSDPFAQVSRRMPASLLSRLPPIVPHHSQTDFSSGPHVSATFTEHVLYWLHVCWYTGGKREWTVDLSQSACGDGVDSGYQSS